MQDKSSNRLNKINEEIKKEISYIINYEVKNSKITGIITVTKVKTSPDLKYSKVYISMLNTKNKKETLRGLKAASGFIRCKIAKKINLRTTPEFIFEFDESLEYGEKIENILKDIMKEIENKK